MLRKDGAQAHEMLSQLAGGCVVTDGPDYHHEAREYEKKLIQVSPFSISTERGDSITV